MWSNMNYAVTLLRRSKKLPRSCAIHKQINKKRAGKRIWLRCDPSHNSSMSWKLQCAASDSLAGEHLVFISTSGLAVTDILTLALAWSHSSCAEELNRCRLTVKSLRTILHCCPFGPQTAAPTSGPTRLESWEGITEQSVHFQTCLLILLSGVDHKNNLPPQERLPTGGEGCGVNPSSLTWRSAFLQAQRLTTTVLPTPFQTWHSEKENSTRVNNETQPCVLVTPDRKRQSLDRK